MSCARWVLVCFLCHDTDHSSLSSVSRREDCVLSNETLCDTDKTAPPSVSWRAGRRKAHCRIQSPPNVQPAEFSDSECLFTYSLLSGSCGEKEKGQTDNSTDLSNLAPRNSEMMNLWRDFLQWFLLCRLFLYWAKGFSLCYQFWQVRLVYLKTDMKEAVVPFNSIFDINHNMTTFFHRQ